MVVDRAVETFILLDGKQSFMVYASCCSLYDVEE